MLSLTGPDPISIVHLFCICLKLGFTVTNKMNRDGGVHRTATSWILLILPSRSVYWISFWNSVSLCLERETEADRKEVQGTQLPWWFHCLDGHPKSWQPQGKVPELRLLLGVHADGWKGRGLPRAGWGQGMGPDPPMQSVPPLTPRERSASSIRESEHSRLCLFTLILRKRLYPKVWGHLSILHVKYIKRLWRQQGCLWAHTQGSPNPVRMSARILLAYFRTPSDLTELY